MGGLGEEGVLKAHELRTSTPGIVHPELNRAIAAMNGISITEEFLEGIHRSIHKEGDRATNTSVPWASAINSLRDNVDLHQQVVGSTRCAASVFGR